MPLGELLHVLKRSDFGARFLPVVYRMVKKKRGIINRREGLKLELINFYLILNTHAGIGNYYIKCLTLPTNHML